jgi:hypothetical protein
MSVINLWRSCAVASLTVLLLLILPAAAPAGTLHSDAVPTVSISVDSAPGLTFDFTPSESELVMSGSDHGRKLGTPKAFDNILGGRADVVIQELEFDPDPFVVNNYLVTNPLTTTQVYTIGTGLLTSFAAPNTISGSVLTAVIDSSGNGTATVATAATPIYRAQIDGSTVATLQDPAFSVSVPPGVLNNASASFGPSANLVPVTSDIGILLRFSLTPGDTATIISRFDVVPEPTSLGLGFLALLAGVVISGRRSR